MFWAPPPPPPVSYAREVAPILAMHCSGCHGGAGGLSTRNHARLIAGGNLGPVIVPGDPGRSLILHFIKGLRGEQRRMPPGGAPLNETQVATLARWIGEGAKHDGEPASGGVLMQVVTIGPGVRIQARIDTSAYLIVRALDPESGRTLWSDEGPVKTPRERGDIGVPGAITEWTLRPAPGWPATIAVHLEWRFARPSAQAELNVTSAN